MAKLSDLDLAFNACVDVANVGLKEMEDAIEEYNRAAVAANTLHGVGPSLARLVFDKHKKPVR